MEKLKDVIKQVAHIGFPSYGIHESKLVKQLFFRRPDYTKYSKKLIKYQIIELITNKEVLKMLIEFNY